MINVSMIQLINVKGAFSIKIFLFKFSIATWLDFLLTSLARKESFIED